MINVRGRIQGYCALYETPDLLGRMTKQGAYRKSLLRLKHFGLMPPLVLDHSFTRPAGHILSMREDTRGVFVRVQLDLELDRVQERLQPGKQLAFSLAYTVKKGTAEVAEEVDIRELTVTTSPAQPLCIAEPVPLQITSEAEFAQFLRECGVDGESTQVLASRGWQGLTEVTSSRDPHHA